MFFFICVLSIVGCTTEDVYLFGSSSSPASDGRYQRNFSYVWDFVIATERGAVFSTALGSCSPVNGTANSFTQQNVPYATIRVHSCTNLPQGTGRFQLQQPFIIDHNITFTARINISQLDYLCSSIGLSTGSTVVSKVGLIIRYCDYKGQPRRYHAVVGNSTTNSFNISSTIGARTGMNDFTIKTYSERFAGTNVTRVYFYVNNTLLANYTFPKNWGERYIKWGVYWDIAPYRIHNPNVTADLDYIDAHMQGGAP